MAVNLVNPYRYASAAPSGYSAEVLADTPLAYYRLAEPSGSTMVDASGNARDGAYTSITLGTTGLLASDATNTAATFGASSKGETAYASWAAVSTLTVEAIIKPSSVSGTHVIASRHSDPQASWAFRTDGTALRMLTWQGVSGSGFRISTSSATLATSTTYHVAVTISGNSLAFYVNGSTAGTDTLSGSIYAGSSVFRVGASFAGENFAGVIDEVAYYGTALSGARIAAHYAAA